MSASEFKQHWHGRLIEAIGGRLMRWGVPLATLTEESVCRTARRWTRLEHFGGDEFRQPLRILLDDLDRDRELSVIGRIAIRFIVVEGLINRLRIRDALERHPTICNVELRDPLFVVGMPRTGTTLLHNLLARDPDGRAPLLWELNTPWPRIDRRGRRPDPRIAKMQRRVKLMTRASPNGATIHEFHALEPEECHHLFRNSMATQTFRAFADVPGFMGWKLSHDMLAEYRYYRMQLQMLLWQRPAGHLVLKYPGHAWHLDALLEVMPDARIVFTHRDPADTLGSFCSMVSAVRQGMRRNFEPRKLGPLLAEEIEIGLRRMITWRDAADPSRFTDVRYDELVRDPAAEVQRVYAHFRAPFPRSMREEIERWLTRHRQHRHGKHEYRLSDYGLGEREVRERFAFYDLHRARAERSG